MENLKVFILTEGSKNIGFGHITRCLSLYQEFEEYNIHPNFIIHGDDSLTGLLQGTNYELIDWMEIKNIFLGNITGSDIGIIDSYLANNEFYEQFSKSFRIPVYIDDNKRIDYHKGIVVNGNIHALSLNYPTKENVIYRLGTHYTPLRKEFYDVPEKVIHEEVKSILITFGGDDIRDITPKVLKLLTEYYPNSKKNVIIGQGFKNRTEINNVVDKNTTLTLNATGAQMKEFMLECDIAISAGGQTLYELARIGVPNITVVVAQNQLESVIGWQKTGFTEYAGWWEDSNILDRIKNGLDKLKDVNKRIEINRIGKALIDGRGSERIVEFILSRFNMHD